MEGIVMKFLEDLYIALIELSSGAAVEVTSLGSTTVIDVALLVSTSCILSCAGITCTDA